MPVGRVLNQMAWVFLEEYLCIRIYKTAELIRYVNSKSIWQYGTVYIDSLAKTNERGRNGGTWATCEGGRHHLEN